MSGGSLDYVYGKVEDAAAQIANRAETPEQHAFAAHLLKVAKALHDLEWVWSSDKGRGEEVEAIMACINRVDVLRMAVDRAQEAKHALERVIASCHSESRPALKPPWCPDCNNQGRPFRADNYVEKMCDPCRRAFHSERPT